ncbi:MAG: 16S rRNA (cytosine(1402)-N(4))-methyltransferase RsmH [Ruminococcaceae bacterium]|nr:16S rRNA (cytosine(1402)-N(4))-methyltransferase RsmH [Oscillospiraceae bacterium]
MEFNHYSVMLKESVDFVAPAPGGIYVDCTLGGGGHSLEILNRMGETGRLIAVDRDTDAIKAASERLKNYKNVTYVHDNYENIGEYLNDVEYIDGAVMDLGVSSYQLDTAERGFSYMKEAPLDMRMNRSETKCAYDVVNGYSYEQLCDILYKYGEEKQAKRIVNRIIRAREEKAITTTTELAEIIKSAVGNSYDDKHPAKRTFQAIRIEVNDELSAIPKAIHSLVKKLRVGGTVAVITFHSLEDRVVKETLKKYEDGCTCPPNFPMCVCGFKKQLEVITRKPILPDSEELKENSRSQSAKLRAARKVMEV